MMVVVGAVELPAMVHDLNVNVIVIIESRCRCSLLFLGLDIYRIVDTYHSSCLCCDCLHFIWIRPAGYRSVEVYETGWATFLAMRYGKA